MKNIRELIRTSPFSRSCYSVDIPLERFHKNMMMFIDDDLQDTDFDYNEIFKAVPVFQRDNDKWNVNMQTKFIENILLGCKSTILMCEIADNNRHSDLCHCYILDGLQRITAIHEFIVGDVLAFGKTFKELREERLISNVRCRIKLNIYTFPNTDEAIDFYIAMNENITHSKQDIDKAKKHLTTYKGK